VYHSLVKKFTGKKEADQTNNGYNKFVQYVGSNSKQTDWEERILVYASQCLQTKGFTQKEILSDFYFVAGTKPFDSKNKDEKFFDDMQIPQLQWTAMCCVMQFKPTANTKEKDIILSGGYISTNEEPTKGRKSDRNNFDLYPDPSKEMLRDLASLAEAIEKYNGPNFQNNVKMTIKNFFGGDSPCEAREREQSWTEYFFQSKSQ